MSDEVEELPKRGLASDLSFECRVARIEAFSHEDAAEQNLTWDVSYVEVGQLRSFELVIVTAHLVVGANNTWGQVLVVGQLVAQRAFLDRCGELAPSFVPGFVEQMWDVGRRALRGLLVSMDADLDLPLMSPPTAIERQPSSRLSDQDMLRADP